MDVKQYYRKIYEVETGLSDKYPVVVSLETSDGGKPGVLSEVPRSVAAKMVVEGRAELASSTEKERYFAEQAFTKKAAEKAELARRLQVAIISDGDLRAAKNGDDRDAN
jgi:hypothetical protein